jgi:hypothetical protein
LRSCRIWANPGVRYGPNISPYMPRVDYITLVALRLFYACFAKKRRIIAQANVSVLA